MWSLRLAKLALVLWLILPALARADDPSQADPPQALLEQWKHYFNAESFYDPVRDVTRFLKASPSCGRSVSWVVDQVADYGKRVQASRDKAGEGDAAERIFLKIKSFLASQKSGNDPCAGISVKAYYLASAVLAQNGTPENYNVFSYERTEALGPSLVGIYLANTDHLSIEFGDPPKFDVVEPDGKSPPEMLGDYVCDRSKIRFFVKPDLSNLLRPYDAGADFSLEEDHLLRDKNTPYESIQAHYSTPAQPNKVDWNSYFLDDETLALVLAASQQRQLKYHNIGKYDEGGSDRVFGGKPAEETADFSFLKPGSNFARINGNKLDPTQALFPNRSWENEVFLPDQEYVRGIFYYTERVYFGMSALDGRFDCHLPIPPALEERYERGAVIYRQPLFPNYYWSTRNPEGSGLAPIPRADSRFRAKEQYEIPSLLLPNHLTDPFVASADPVVRSPAEEASKINVGPFLSTLKELDQKMSGPSEACARFDQALQNGEVPPGYAGLPRRTGVAPSQPSGNGSKPSGNGSKPSGRQTPP